MSCTNTSCCLFRLTLSALHFNENSSRVQATTASGEERFEVLYPKYKKGSHIVRKILAAPTYSMLPLLFCYCTLVTWVQPVAEYVDKLMEETQRRCKDAVIKELPEDDIPAPLCSQYEKPVKSDAIKSHRSRFSLTWSCSSVYFILMLLQNIIFQI